LLSYNGFGGKLEAGETPAQAAARELKVCHLCVPYRPSHRTISFLTKEECGIEASLEHCGTLLFSTKGGPEWAFQIEIYRADAYSGTLIEFVPFTWCITYQRLSFVQDRGDAT
jgi:8-oxo-dGTP diphosphatase / 2-hydroxy-dATP diphosphatase